MGKGWNPGAQYCAPRTFTVPGTVDRYSPRRSPGVLQDHSTGTHWRLRVGYRPRRGRADRAGDEVPDGSYRSAGRGASLLRLSGQEHNIMTSPDFPVDVLVVGSGNGALTAALCA